LPHSLKFSEPAKASHTIGCRPTCPSSDFSLFGFRNAFVLLNSFDDSFFPCSLPALIFGEGGSRPLYIIFYPPLLCSPLFRVRTPPPPPVLSAPSFFTPLGPQKYVPLCADSPFPARAGSRALTTFLPMTYPLWQPPSSFAPTASSDVTRFFLWPATRLLLRALPGAFWTAGVRMFPPPSASRISILSLIRVSPSPPPNHPPPSLHDDFSFILWM